MATYYKSDSGFSTVLSDLTVTGNAIIGSDLLVGDDIEADSITAHGDVDVDGSMKTDLLESHTADGTVLVSDEIEMVSGEQLFIDDGDATAPGLAIVRAGVRDGNTGFAGAVSADEVMVVTGGAFRGYFTASQFSTPGAVGINAGGQFLMTSDITPTALTGNVTDYAPTGITTASRLRIDPGAAGRVINSLSGGADGRRLVIYNISATQTLTLLHDDGATGTAAMRFLCPGSVSLVIPVNGVREIEYDSTSSRWRVSGSVA